MRSDHADLDLEVAASGGVGDDDVRVFVSGELARTLLERLHAADGGKTTELVDLTVVDRRDTTPPAVEVVYRLGSADPPATLRVHARVDVDPGADSWPGIDSVVSLWPMADWLEREARELFGVEFRGHPTPRPLLLGERPEALLHAPRARGRAADERRG